VLASCIQSRGDFRMAAPCLSVECFVWTYKSWDAEDKKATSMLCGTVQARKLTYCRLHFIVRTSHTSEGTSNSSLRAFALSARSELICGKSCLLVCPHVSSQKLLNRSLWHLVVGGFYGKRLSTKFNFGSFQSNTVLHGGYQKQIIVQQSIPRLKYHQVNGF
jgi:hypothetical protein